jgi:protein gp37
MGHNSNIEWCDHTFNPWIGCTKVSPGCANCYAETLDRNRFSKTLGGASKAAPVSHWGKGAPRYQTSVANWKQPLAWDKAARGEGRPTLECPSCEAPWSECECGFAQRKPRVFCASLADWLDDEVPIEWLCLLLSTIDICENLDWLMLTKRPQNWRSRLVAVTHYSPASRGGLLAHRWLAENAPSNVWVGTTVEDQLRADERIPELLLQIPARIRFLSCEPLLGPVNLDQIPDGGNGTCFSALTGAYTKGIPEDQLPPLPYPKTVDWVICGGESGKDARPFVVEWADDIRRQCETAGVPFFMKQMGDNPITSNANVLDWPEDTIFRDDLLDPKWAAGASVEFKDKKGGNLAEFPEELRIRQFPGENA